jgi:acyl-CoA synthetase (NDP forming)
VIRAKTFEDLLDILAALAAGRKLTAKRVTILTSTGGAGTIVSDSLGVAGFETPAPDAETAAHSGRCIWLPCQPRSQSVLECIPLTLLCAR